MGYLGHQLNDCPLNLKTVFVTLIMADITKLIQVLIIQHKELMDEQVKSHQEQMDEQARQYK